MNKQEKEILKYIGYALSDLRAGKLKDVKMELLWAIEEIKV
jgi:hypothetical protein